MEILAFASKHLSTKAAVERIAKTAKDVEPLRIFTVEANPDYLSERTALLGSYSRRDPTHTSYAPSRPILAQEITGEGINRSTNREGFDRILGPTHHALKENPHVQEIIRKFADEEIQASACRGCPERRFNVDIDSTGFLLSCYDEGDPNGVSRIETRIPFDKAVLNPALAMQYYVNDLARLHLTAGDATVQALKDFAPYGTPGATSLGSINTSLTPDERDKIAESIQMRRRLTMCHEY
nr:hypothetical protein L203_06589 [Cryptococcus depauperatus CBS 7841]